MVLCAVEWPRPANVSGCELVAPVVGLGAGGHGPSLKGEQPLLGAVAGRWGYVAVAGLQTSKKDSESEKHRRRYWKGVKDSWVTGVADVFQALHSLMRGWTGAWRRHWRP